MKRLALVTATTAAVLGLASPAYAFHCYNASNPVNLNASKATFQPGPEEGEGTIVATNPGYAKKLAADPTAVPTGGFVTIIDENGAPLVSVYAKKRGVIPNADKGPSDHGVNYLSGP